MRTLTADARLDRDEYHRLLGMFVLLAGTTPGFGGMRVEEALSTMHGALMAGTYCLYADAEGRPAGGLLWAWLDEAVAEGYLATGRIGAPEAWRSGPQLWLVHVIAEGGLLRRVVADVQGPLFEGTEACFMLRRMPDGSNRVVRFDRRGARLHRLLPPIPG